MKPILPEVIVNEIKKMACIKSSNGKKGNNFIIICNFKSVPNKTTVKEIYTWLFGCLNLIKHPAVWDGNSYYWNIILNTYGQENVNEYNCAGEIITFYIHTNRWTSGMDKNGLIIETEIENNIILEVDITTTFSTIGM